MVYVVTAATFDRIPLFHNLTLGRLVVAAFRYQHERLRAFTLAFVVMPDHFHWLVQLGGERSLTQVVHSVKSYSAHRINEHQGRSRKIWQTGFHDHAVRKDESLRTIARYIVENPLRAGLVADIGRYSLWDVAWPM